MEKNKKYGPAKAGPWYFNIIEGVLSIQASESGIGVQFKTQKMAPWVLIYRVFGINWNDCAGYKS